MVEGHSVVVCVHNALADVTACIESLKPNLSDLLEIIVVDDASEEPTRRYAEALSAQGLARHARLDERLGYTKAANAGMRMARGSVVTLLNSDTILPCGWGAKTLQAFADNPEFGIVGPLSNAASYQSVPGIAGTAGQTAINRLPRGVTVDEMDRFCAQAGAGKLMPYVPLVHGFCMSMSRRCIEEVGAFDEDAFPLGYGEENDFCIRAVDAGFALGVLVTCYVYHAKSKSYGAQERTRLMQAGWEALVAKHGRQRLVRAVKIMEEQPVLQEMRRAVGGAFAWEEAPEPAAQPAPAVQIAAGVAASAAAGATDIKVIAFYLPQFHPTDFNDRTWGQGFTEWRNVVKARPRFPGHSQPRLPGALGFYDLRRTAVMQEQAELAARHGVHGVCMYYYRLGGRRLLQQPPEALLADRSLALRFCYCWANESWTRAWDGHSSDVLLAQEYDDATFWGLVNDVALASEDARYITLAGRPVLLIYQVSEIPDAPAWVRRLRAELDRITGRKFLIGSVFSVRFRAEMLDFVDFVVQFPPHRIPRNGRRITVPATEMAPFEPERGDYYEAFDDVVAASLGCADALDRMVLGVCPDWDNTPRRATNAHTLVGGTPEKFREWVRQAADATRAKFAAGRLPEKVLFVNAWNEWAEGAALEPSEAHGAAYLEALRDGLGMGG